MKLSLLFSLISVLLLFKSVVVNAADLKIYILAGQSNMEGQAEVSTKNVSTGLYLNGTLAYQVYDPRTAALFSPLFNNVTKEWVVLENVKVWYNENASQSGVNGSSIPSAPGEAAFGSLTVGFGSSANPNLIGPEYGFGWGMNNGEQFLIMKTAWGGKTLAGDFRPPSSVRDFDPYCQGTCPNVVGHYYLTMISDIYKMLVPGAIHTMFPDIDINLTPIIGGFGWYQGYNDGCDLNQTAAYETNMVNFIKDLRSEFNNTQLPFSIAVAGFNGFNHAEDTRYPKSNISWIDMDPFDKINTECTIDHGCRRLDIALSQLAAGNATRHPELGGHVFTSETRGFWRDVEYSPNKQQGYHYWHNAETCFLVGQAMANGMKLASIS